MLLGFVCGAFRQVGKETGKHIPGILNPSIISLMSRVRHTNTVVIADRGFSYFRGIETVDISLVEGIPRVVDVLHAIRLNFNCGKGVMAAELQEVSSAETLAGYERA